MATFPRPRMPAGVKTLPARYYTDPAHFSREMERIHFHMWLCAGREEQLDAPGRHFLRRVGNASVIVLRGEDGAIRAFHNVCRHRGTLLCEKPEGQFAARIQCPYHGWTYRLDGTLAAAPHMDQVEGFHEADYPLRTVATDLWDGHVFINLSDDPAPLSGQLASLPGKFNPWGMSQLRRVERRNYSLKANWKLVFQNYSECLHCPIVHPLLQRQSHYLSGDNEPPQPTYLGGRMDLREGVQTLSMDGTTNRACLPGLSADDRRRVYYYAILPNLLLNLHPDYMLTFTLWPLAPDRTEIVCEWHFHPEAIARPDFDPSSAIEFWDLTNRQDWELSERAQEGIASLGYLPGPYSNREELLHALDRFVLERVEGSAAPFANVYDDATRAAAYATLEYPATYYLAFRDLPEMIRRHVTGRRALDFGCGTGRSTRFLKGLGFETSGVDVAADMLARAKERDPDGDYRLIRDGDLGPADERGYDLVLSAFTFDNVPTMEKKVRLFEALGRVLSARGRIVNLVSAPEIYTHEWASFTTEAFRENRSARAGDTVRIVMKDVPDKRPVEDVLWTDEAYRDTYRLAGLETVEIHRPLAREGEPYEWVNETTIAPWVVYVLKRAERA